jgi:hypothetical protein
MARRAELDKPAKRSAAHAAAVSLNGSAGGAPTAAERAAKRKASKMNRGVYLDLVTEKRDRVKRHFTAMRILDLAHAQQRDLTPMELRFVQWHRLTNLDLSHMGSDVSDRYGDPRLTKQEIDLAASKPVLIRIQGGLGWPEPVK